MAACGTMRTYWLRLLGCHRHFRIEGSRGAWCKIACSIIVYFRRSQERSCVLESLVTFLYIETIWELKNENNRHWKYCERRCMYLKADWTSTIMRSFEMISRSSVSLKTSRLQQGLPTGANVSTNIVDYFVNTRNNFPLKTRLASFLNFDHKFDGHRADLKCIIYRDSCG